MILWEIALLPRTFPATRTTAPTSSLLLGSATYTYGNGNTLTKTDASGTTTYTWDFENRLTSVQLPGSTAVTFKYDPFGRRIQKESSIYLYEGANLVEEADGSGTETTHYLFGPGIDEPLSALRGGTTEFYQGDGLGSVTSFTTDTGSLTDAFLYDSFGNPTSVTGAFSQPFRFTGREWDGETGLYYYRARYYDSLSGRFISEDPLRFSVSPNFYPYVRNNPQNFIDPSGNIPIAVPVPWWWVGSGTAGGILAGVGRFAGSVGMAGTVGWGIGRGVGHIPIYGGGTVDDGWQQLFTLLFFQQASQSAAQAKACNKDNAYCEKKKQECIQACLPQLGKGGRTNQGFPFRNCIRACLKTAGCEGYGDFW